MVWLLGLIDKELKMASKKTIVVSARIPVVNLAIATRLFKDNDIEVLNFSALINKSLSAVCSQSTSEVEYDIDSATIFLQEVGFLRRKGNEKVLEFGSLRSTEGEVEL